MPESQTPHVHQPGCVHFAAEQRSKATGQPAEAEPVDGHFLTVRPDAHNFLRMKAQVEHQLKLFSEAKEPSSVVLKRLERIYMRMHQRRVMQEMNIKGAKLLKILYKRTVSGEVVTLYWDWVPGPMGPMLIGICPECFVNAPMQVDPLTQTKPTFFDSRLAWIKGNPEADAKVVTFRLTSPLYYMRIDDHEPPRLTVREIVRCPGAKHGPNEKIVRRCDWAVRVQDGIASQVGRSIVRGSGAGGAIRGPLIIVK